jgi:hypothetical protein
MDTKFAVPSALLWGIHTILAGQCAFMTVTGHLSYVYRDFMAIVLTLMWIHVLLGGFFLWAHAQPVYIRWIIVATIQMAFVVQIMLCVYHEFVVLGRFVFAITVAGYLVTLGSFSNIYFPDIPRLKYTD